MLLQITLSNQFCQSKLTLNLTIFPIVNVLISIGNVYLYVNTYYIYIYIYILAQRSMEIRLHHYSIKIQYFLVTVSC